MSSEEVAPLYLYRSVTLFTAYTRIEFTRAICASDVVHASNEITCCVSALFAVTCWYSILDVLLHLRQICSGLQRSLHS